MDNKYRKMRHQTVPTVATAQQLEAAITNDVKERRMGSRQRNYFRLNFVCTASALAMCCQPAQAWIENLSFDNGLMPPGWVSSLVPGSHGSDFGIRNGRLEAGQVDTVGEITRPLDFGPFASFSSLSVSFATNGSANPSGAFGFTRIKDSTGATIGSGTFGKAGFDQDRMVIRASINQDYPARYVDNAKDLDAFKVGTYRVTTTFSNGSVQISAADVDGGPRAVTSLDGVDFDLRNARYLSVGAGNTSGVPQWVDDVRVKGVPVTTALTNRPSDKASLLSPIVLARAGQRASANEHPNKLELQFWDRTSGAFVDQLGDFSGQKKAYVLVHGWIFPTDRNRTERAPLQDVQSGIVDLAKVLAALPGDAPILAWNWTADASTVLSPQGFEFVPNEKIPLQSMLLAQRLRETLATPSGIDIQLIGHSLGGGISARVAATLQRFSDSGVHVSRVTMLDVPRQLVAKGVSGDVDVTRELNVLKLGSALTTVESYYGLAPLAFGKSFGDVAADSAIIGADHSGVASWYAGTISAQNSGMPNVGGFGEDVVSLARRYDSDLCFTSPNSFVAAASSALCTADKAANLPITIIKAEVGAFAAVGTSAASLVEIVGPKAIAAEKSIGLWLESHSPASAAGDFDVPANASFLRAAFRPLQWSAGDYLYLALDDEVLFALGSTGFDTDWLSTGLLDVGSYAGHSATLTLGYYSANAGNGVVFTDIEFLGRVAAIPEPQTLALMLFGIAGLGLRLIPAHVRALRLRAGQRWKSAT